MQVTDGGSLRHEDVSVKEKDMRRTLVVLLAAVMAMFGVVAIAQQRSGNDSQPSQSQPSQPGMMGAGRMGIMGQMGAHHQQMVENMDKLMQSLSAIEAEKDPAALKAKLAAHRALLEQMRSQMTQQDGMMQQMRQMMGASPCNQPPASK
jgi:hypothetical protein